MPTPDDFRAHVAALAAAAAVAEPRFLVIGRTLEQATGALARQVDAAETLRAGMESATLTSAFATLGRSAAGIAALTGRHAGELATLARLAGMASGLGEHIVAMQAVAREIDMLALNARLAAAGMGERGGEFMAFAGDINACARLAAGQLDRIRTEVGAAVQYLRTAQVAITAFATRHHSSITVIPARLAANVEQVADRGRLAVTAAARIAVRCEEIRHQVAAQIIALQFGDIVRQRIEHVHDAALLLAAATGPGAAALHAVGSRLLADQLLDIVAELDQESAAITAGLVALAEAAHDIGQITATAYGASDRTAGSFLAELQSDVRQTQVLLVGLHEAETAKATQINAVLESTSSLARHVATVRAIEADIRILGLNTTLKCSRLGTVGQPLGVVAQELRELGTRTATQAAAMLKALAEMAALAGLLGESDPQGVGDIVGGMTAAVAPLNRLGPELTEALTKLEVDSEHVATLLQSAATGFAVRHEIGSALRQVAAALGTDNDAAVTSVDEAGRDVLARIANNYTMARERDIHARVLPWAGAIPAPAEATLEDMLF
jgi:hypothetical protein